MAAVNLRIQRYQYELHLGSAEKAPQPLASLYLYGAKNALLAVIAFLPDDAERVPAEENANGIIVGSQSISEFQRLIDMLRNEKPVTLCWHPDRQWLRVTTDSEPVGEEELRKLFSFLFV